MENLVGVRNLSSCSLRLAEKPFQREKAFLFTHVRLAGTTPSFSKSTVVNY